MDVCKDVKTLLTSIVSATSIFLHDLPETPDNYIVLSYTDEQPRNSAQYTLGGPKKPAFEQLRIELLVRHETPATAFTWIESIQDTLDATSAQTINGHYYIGFSQYGNINPIGKDKKHRFYVAIEYNILVTR